MFTTLTSKLSRSISLRVLPVAGAALLATLPSASADPLFVSGSTFQVEGENSPDSFTDNATLPGTTSLDGDALELTTTIVPVPNSSSEWLVFSYTTANGGPLSQGNEDWSLAEVGLDAGVPVNFSAGYVAFSDDGTVLTPTSSIFGGYSVEANPVPGETGTGLGGNGFVDPISSGLLPSLGTYIYPFGYLNDTGINSADVTGYEEALEFAPQVVPEPTTWVMLLGSTALLVVAQRRTTAMHRMKGVRSYYRQLAA